MKKIWIQKRNRAVWIIAMGLIGLLFCMEGHAFAEDSVHGTYISSEGRSIVLELQILSPPPSSLIVQQFLPPGTEIVSAKPELKQFRQDKGIAKWLLTKLAPGKLSIDLQLAATLPAGTVRAEVRYRDQITGKMVQKEIKP